MATKRIWQLDTVPGKGTDAGKPREQRYVAHWIDEESQRPRMKSFAAREEAVEFFNSNKADSVVHEVHVTIESRED